MKNLYVNKIEYDDKSTDIFLTIEDCKKLLQDCVYIYNSMGEFDNETEFLEMCSKYDIDERIKQYVFKNLGKNMINEWFECNIYDVGLYNFLCDILNYYNLEYNDYQVRTIYYE